VTWWFEDESVKVDIRSLGVHLTGLAWVALRSFAITILVLSVAGVALAALSYYFLREHHWAYGVIAAAAALFESVTIGIVLGTKRAVVMAIAHGLAKLRLGGFVVGLVFERMLGVAEGKEFGERGGRVSQGLERLPLARADELLSGAVRDLTGEAEQGGWLRRKIRGMLLEAVRKYTLARFREEGAKHGGVDLLKLKEEREEGAKHGGVDLLKLKEELEQTIDEALVAKVRGGLRLWTILVIVGLPVVVAVQTWVLLMLLHARG
jgi:hypothetical protein